jgi:hypothetical protein
MSNCLGGYHNRYIQAPILINPNWELEFHVHTYAFQLTLGAILVENLTCKIDQPIMYSSRLLNFANKLYYYKNNGFSYGVCLTKI